VVKQDRDMVAPPSSALGDALLGPDLAWVLLFLESQLLARHRNLCGGIKKQLRVSRKTTEMASIVTGLTRMTDVQVIQFAKKVHTALMDNANVPAPNPPLPRLQELIAAAEVGLNGYEAEKAVLRNKKNLRDEAIKALCNGLRQEADTVQAATSGDPDRMETTGFRTGKRPTPVGTPDQVTRLVLESGPTEGTLKASWKPVRGVKVYEMETSPDPMGASSWAYKGTATKARAVINNFVSGTRIWLRVRAIGAAGPGPWSDPAVKTVP
jgi:hypothetical protein